MNDFGIGFDDSDCVFNVVSKAVLPIQSANEVLAHGNIGTQLYTDFVIERFHGSLSVWAPLKKCKLKSFKVTKKVLKTKVGEKVVQLKEEKSLLTRFMTTARKRPELDLEHCFGNFEFSVVPKSLFTNDGQPLTCTDKFVVLHEIENLSELGDQSPLDVSLAEEEEHKVIVIDRTAVVNQIAKTKLMMTCQVI